MDKYMTSHLDMFEVVIELCRMSPDAVALVPAFADDQVYLKTETAAIRVLAKPLVKNKKGTGLTKTALKKSLALQLGVVCGAGMSLAAANNDQELYALFHYRPGGLKKMRDEMLVETGEVLLDLATTHGTALERYAISRDTLADARATWTQFKTRKPQPIAKRADDKALRKEVRRRIGLLSKFLYGRMSNAAKSYLLLDALFYDKFVNATRLLDPGLRHRNPPTPPPAKKQANATTAAESPAADAPAPIPDEAAAAAPAAVVTPEPEASAPATRHDEPATPPELLAEPPVNGNGVH